MRFARAILFGWVLPLVLMATACGKDEGMARPPGSAGSGGSGGSAGNGALTHCLDRPGELPRPPTGRLPCELIPPGLTLAEK